MSGAMNQKNRRRVAARTLVTLISCTRSKSKKAQQWMTCLRTVSAVSISPRALQFRNDPAKLSSLKTSYTTCR